MKPAMELYEPVHVLKPITEDLAIVDGPVVRMAFPGGSVPFPTRATVARLSDGSLWVHSPTEPDEGLFAQLDAWGPVRHLVSPNKIHYAWIGPWKQRYPEATAWASPGVRERAEAQGIEVAFDADLEDAPPEAWAPDIDQLIFRGSRFMEEVVFLHRASRTLILADLIENFEPQKVAPRWRWAMRLGGVTAPDGKAPADLRATFIGRKELARESLQRMKAWAPERIVLSHGAWFPEGGAAELDRAFAWLD
ncbi:MAG: DUF4336 domain-containing protein [Alphaproteobacteria bacterium]|nr:DUF4336 domain-containing protein [Alphaproteobacteria bacterium]